MDTCDVHRVHARGGRQDRGAAQDDERRPHLGLCLRSRASAASQEEEEEVLGSEPAQQQGRAAGQLDDDELGHILTVGEGGHLLHPAPVRHVRGVTL